MKGRYLSLLFGAFVFAAAVQPNVAQAQFELPPQYCMTDNFGFVWDVTVSGCSGCVCNISGVVDIGGGVFWTVSGTYNRCTRAVTLRATNPTPDNCTTQSSFFDYTGQVDSAGGGVFQLSGSWTNDCGGAGTWTGTATRGACRVGPAEVDAINPVVAKALADAAAVIATEGTMLSASYPNPFTSTATIAYTLDATSDVRLAVYDVLGREVAVLVNEARTAGTHTVQWDADAALPAGTYLYRITAGDRTETQQMMLTR